MSALTVTDLRLADPAAMRSASYAWAALGDALDASYETFLTGQKEVDQGGSGQAIRAAAGKVVAQGHELSGLCVPARRIGQALLTQADVTRDLQAQLADVLARARSYGVIVDETTGGASVPTELRRQDPELFGELAREIRGDLNEILRRARAVDDETDETIRSNIPAPNYGFGREVDWRVDRATVEQQLGKSPADVNAWWETLSPEQQEWVLADYPDLVGGLGGIPCADRDQANRINLDRQLQQAREQADAYEYLLAHPGADPFYADPFHHYPGADQQHRYELQQQANAWRASANGLAAVHDKLSGTPNSYLLLIDGAGDGKVSIAIGNPDTAAHTALLVPGMATDLTDVGGDVDRVVNLQAAADASTPAPNDVAVVYWLGYDPPDGIATAADSGPSHQGAAALTPFVDALRVTHTASPDPYHLTAIGHSYGSTVVGEAAVSGQLHVDDIITAGSPGMHADRAADLNIDPSHVWTGRAGDDPIRFSPGFIHGPDPTDPGFGANTYAVDTHGHSDYWKTNTLALQNQAYIVTGQYDRVVLVHGANG